MVLDQLMDQRVPVLSGVADPVKSGAVDVGLEPLHVGRKLDFDGCRKKIKDC